MRMPQRYYSALFFGLVPVNDTRGVSPTSVQATVAKEVRGFRKGEVVQFLRIDLVVKAGRRDGHQLVRQVGPETEDY